MRDSIGGTMLFWIVLFLFSIFIIFIAFIIKYARVYRIKNSAISYIEKNEGVLSQSEFESQILSMGYSPSGEYKICRYLLGDKGGYYKLYLYSRTEFPVVGDLVSLNIAIIGETRTIETGVKIRNYGSNATGWFNSMQDECKMCSINGSCVNIDARG